MNIKFWLTTKLSDPIFTLKRQRFAYRKRKYAVKSGKTQILYSLNESN